MKKLILSIIVIAIFLATAMPVLAANVVYFDPLEITGAVNDIINIPIMIDAADEFSSFQTDIIFDENIIEVLQVERGAAIIDWTWFAFDNPDTPSNWLRITGFKIGEGISGNTLEIANLAIEAKAAGNTSLHFEESFLTDPLAYSLETTWEDANVSVTSVPEPNTFILLGSSLIGLLGRFIRKR